MTSEVERIISREILRHPLLWTQRPYQIVERDALVGLLAEEPGGRVLFYVDVSPEEILLIMHGDFVARTDQVIQTNPDLTELDEVGWRIVE